MPRSANASPDGHKEVTLRWPARRLKASAGHRRARSGTDGRLGQADSVRQWLRCVLPPSAPDAAGISALAPVRERRARTKAVCTPVTRRLHRRPGAAAHIPQDRNRAISLIEPADSRAEAAENGPHATGRRIGAAGDSNNERRSQTIGRGDGLGPGQTAARHDAAENKMGHCLLNPALPLPCLAVAGFHRPRSAIHYFQHRPHQIADLMQNADSLRCLVQPI